MTLEVKAPDRITRVSSKNQVTLPVAILAEAGVSSGDKLRVVAAGPGRITLERADDLRARFAGALTGVFPPGFLDELRDEWR